VKIVRRLLSRYQPFRVCLWHTGRCGSSVVADLIRRDGRIDWAGEVLERPSIEWAGFSGEGALRRCREAISRRRYDAGRMPFGFEMKLWHYHRLDLTTLGVRNMVAGLGFEKHVVLERRNYLRQRVSGRVAEESGRYHRRAGEKPAAVTITIDLDTLMHFIELCEGFYGTIRAALSDHLYLTYEDDIEVDPTAAYTKIMRHVGLKPQAVTTDRRKTTPRTLRNVIENYEEVAEVLSGTRHAWMLDG